MEEIIPNVRWNDERTYSFCFNGIEKISTVAVDTHGCIKGRDDREYFKRGLKELINKTQPKNIIVYRAMPENIFGEYKNYDINFINFESKFSKSRKQVTV